MLHATEKSYAGDAGGQRFKLRTIAAVPDDDEIGMLIGSKQGYDILQPLQFLEPADEQEVRPASYGRTRACSFGRRSVCRWIRGHSGKDNHLPRKAEFLVLPPAELAHGDKRAHVRKIPLQQARHSPQLRGPSIDKLAADALARRAWLAVMAPEDVGRTDQPVLVRHVKLDGPRWICEQRRTADQRKVVIVDDVELGIGKNPSQLAAIGERPAQLLRQKRRQTSQPALEADDFHTCVVLHGQARRLASKSEKRVDVMNDANPVPLTDQSCCESLDRNGVPAKMIGRVEGRRKTKAQRAHRVCAGEIAADGFCWSMVMSPSPSVPGST